MLKIILGIFLIFSFVSFANEQKNIQPVKIYGYEIQQKYSFDQNSFGSFNLDSLSYKVPGLVFPQLGSYGQRSSFIFNHFTGSDMAIVIDGFEVNDISEPSEAFDINSLIGFSGKEISFQFDGSKDVFPRASGGFFYIQTKNPEGVHGSLSYGSEDLKLATSSYSRCKEMSCLDVNLSVFDVNAVSVSNNKSSSLVLETDPSQMVSGTLLYSKIISKHKKLGLRLQTQILSSQTDDYNESFEFTDDPNAQLNNLNSMLGLSYRIFQNEFFWENSFSRRSFLNESDSFSATERDEDYEAFRSKIRANHYSKYFDLNWFLQSLNIDTETKTKNFSRHALEAGLGLSNHYVFKNFSLTNNIGSSLLESADLNYYLSQTLKILLNQQTVSGAEEIKISYGFKNRRPSLFQLFDPQFGNSQLEGESQIYFRPEWVKSFQKGSLKQTWSLQYFYDNFKNKIGFQALPEPTYFNNLFAELQSLGFQYELLSHGFKTVFNFKRSLDKRSELRNLSWTSRQELGLGFEYNKQSLNIQANIKKLYEMFNPTGEVMGNLVQSQVSLNYRLKNQYQIGLQFANIVNDKTAWDKGYQRQPLSWFLTLKR